MTDLNKKVEEMEAQLKKMKEELAAENTRMNEGNKVVNTVVEDSSEQINKDVKTKNSTANLLKILAVCIFAWLVKEGYNLPERQMEKYNKNKSKATSEDIRPNLNEEEINKIANFEWHDHIKYNNSDRKSALEKNNDSEYDYLVEKYKEDYNSIFARMIRKYGINDARLIMDKIRSIDSDKLF
jgi:hypothetical protein